MSAPLRWLVVMALAYGAIGCGASLGRVETGAGGALGADRQSTRAFELRLRYEAREPTLHGASVRVHLRPARSIEVLALDDDGVVLERAITDDLGRVRLHAEGATKLRALSQIEIDGYSVLVSKSREGGAPHYFDFDLLRGESEELVLADVDPEGIGGAFHILDTIYTGLRAVREWTGEVLPPLTVRYIRDDNSHWSQYVGEYPDGSGRHLIYLMGGEPGRRHRSDGDEHDPHVILHELAHFVFAVLSTNSTPGGMHPTGHLVEPGLAWEEGRATFFAAAVLRAPRYFDTLGFEPHGRLLIDTDLERGGDGPKGEGSQEAVAELLWDLADGDGELPDLDGDPIALGPGRLIRAMIDLGERPGAYPSLSSFLQHLIAVGDVERAPMERLLAMGKHPSSLLEDRWPIELALGSTVSDKIDAINPPKAGGPALKATGIDAVRVYRFELKEASFIEARLRIGSRKGGAINLELRDIRAKLLGRTIGKGREATLARFLEPGFYTIYIRDGGDGAAADFEFALTVD